MHCMYTCTLRVGWTCRLVIRFLNLVFDLWWRAEVVISRSVGILVTAEGLVLLPGLLGINTALRTGRSTLCIKSPTRRLSTEL